MISLLIMKSSSLRRIVGNTYTQQIALAAAGVRPAVRLTIKPDLMRTAFDAIKATGLQVIVGFDTVVSYDVSGRSDYSEWAERAPIRASGADMPRHIYTGHNVKYLERLRRADEADDIGESGRLLGYPSCCVRQFSRLHGHKRSPNCASDPVLRHYGERPSIPWELNVSLLCYDCALLMYVPCCERCTRALEQARNFFSVLTALDSPVSRVLRKSLKTSVIHSDFYGVLSFSGSISQKGVGVRIATIHHVSKSSAMGAIVQVGDLVVRDGHYLTIGAFDFLRNHTKLFEFT
jgi:hypothetical protein